MSIEGVPKSNYNVTADEIDEGNALLPIELQLELNKLRALQASSKNTTLPKLGEEMRIFQEKNARFNELTKMEEDARKARYGQKP